MSQKQVEFGWAARSVAEQYPEVPAADAAHFDADNAAIIRLSIRGIITRPQRDAASKRVARNIFAALKRAAK